MDIAAGNQLGSYQALERGLDIHAGNLAARINADMANAPVLEARQAFGQIQLLPDTLSILAAVTITSCLPGGGSLPTATPTGGYTTVYTTEYVHVCPTATPCPGGTTTSTYTITETCSGNPASYTTPALPPAFTTVVTACNACAGKPTLTVTLPVSALTGTGGGAPAQTGGSSGGKGSGSGGAGTTGSGTGLLQTGAASNIYAMSAAVVLGGILTFAGLVL